MNKVFISRTDSNTPWGFRLQGGLEYNEPLSITNIVPNSPADGKINPGDTLIEIAGTNVTQMVHKDVLELIQRCGNALFLTIQKPGSVKPSDTTPKWKSTEQESVFNYNPLSPSWYDQSSMPTGNIPPAPTLDSNFITNQIGSFMKRQSSTDTYPIYEQSPEVSPILAKFLNRPGGPKPFTYIPGGVDLAKVVESSRARRHRDSRSASFDNQAIDPNMNRRMIVPSEQFTQHRYAAVNPIQPFSYARQHPTPPKKQIEHDTDVITQSRSFQMLQGWISDSEKSTPKTVTSAIAQYSTYKSTDAQNNIDQQYNTDRRRSSSSGATTLPSRSFRYLQEQYSTADDGTMTHVTTKTIASPNGTGLRRGSDAHNPSRAFRYLQDQYHVDPEVEIDQSRTVNNREDLVEIYNKTPASAREREPEAPRYSGSTVPSRSFRYLQMMTSEDDEQNSSKSNSINIKPQQELLNKYDEKNYLTNKNRLNEHPSRSFKYLQEMTGEQDLTQNGSLSNKLNSTDIGVSEF